MDARHRHLCTRSRGARPRGRAPVALALGAALTLAGLVGPPAAAAAATSLEAEQAVLSGGAVVEDEHGGFAGTGYVGGLVDAHRGYAAVGFTVDAETSGTHELQLRYANGTGSERTLSVSADGVERGRVRLPATGGWARWATATTALDLAPGTHEVRYTYGPEDSGNVNLDQLEVVAAASGGGDEPGVGAAAPVAVPGSVELEDAELSGGAVVADEHLGFSGDGFVGGFVDSNRGAATASVRLDVPADGDYDLDLRFANGTGSAKTLSLLLDGAPARQVSVPATAGWSAWDEVRQAVALTAGEHEVAYRFGSGDSGNVNLDALGITPTAPGDGGGTGGSGGSTAPGVDDLATVPSAGGTPFQAEEGHVVDGAVVADVAGTPAAGGLAGPGSRLVVPVRSTGGGAQTVTVRAANGSGDVQRLLLSVDGLPRGHLVVPAGDGWLDLGVELDLSRGLRTVELLQDDANGTGGPLAVDAVLLEAGQAMEERGASVPYTTYEAEGGSTDAQVLGPSRTFHEVAAEASGRKAVRLTATGDSVSWTLTEPASALVLRASIPDTPDGAGQDATIGLYADGRKVADVPVSSRYSWVYGGYPYGNDPSQGGAQRFFDDSRTTFPVLPAGTELRLQKDTASDAARYDVDLVETEVVPDPLPMPAGFVDVRDQGATPRDDSDDRAAFLRAIDAARAAGTGVWVPPGRFTLAQRIDVRGVSIRGAGPWYSVVEGRDGKGGFFATGSGVVITDLMVDGDVRYRDDAAFDAAFEGDFGHGSLLQNVWVEHTKVGLWADRGTRGLLAIGVRIRNTFADGVNLHGDVQETRVTQSVLRNTGDDALAMWSDGYPVTRSVFASNTVHTPLLGNGAGVYGGTSNRVEDNLVSDTLTGSAGIAVGTRFNPVPLSGETLVQRNTLLRTGGWEPNWRTALGAVWVFADSAPITSRVVIRDTRILDSTYMGVLVSYNKEVSDLRLEDVLVDGTGAQGLKVQATGRVTLNGVTLRDLGGPAIEAPAGFQVVDGGGNSY
ncbi:carbohydrate-binding protein [Pseudokineococcus basanitobsidens]|uniref:Carbohydrate-binding protein n=1 Tax=Pseudokineococcus basanitobsidens TaxID=1926649 RepID=A0ABU8RI81_9ACTN